MATYTDNYQFTKPTYAEVADVQTFNNNMTKIDEILHASQVSLAPAYDPAETYNAGNVVMYELLMYECQEDGVTGVWDPTKWARTTAGEHGGGSDVEPNPTGEPTATLNKLGIEGTIYGIEGSGGGGGNVYGAFVDTNRAITTLTGSGSGDTFQDYIAVDDCAVIGTIRGDSGAVQIDGTTVAYTSNSSETIGVCVYARRGQTVSYRMNSSSTLTVYGLIFGTQNIFTPQIYSTEERCVGVWIDNKPLYQKTIVFTNVSKSGTVSFGISNVEMIRLVNGKASDSSPINYVHGSAPTNNVGGFFNISPSDVGWSFRCGNDAPSTISGDITVLYTKTTDTAGSGSYNTLGVPMVHIATDEERVIGTYNGKTLYEITISGDISSTIAIPSLINIIELSGGVTDNNGLYFVPICWNSGNARVICHQSDNGVLSMTNTTDRTKYKITLKYTKITD